MKGGGCNHSHIYTHVVSIKEKIYIYSSLSLRFISALSGLDIQFRNMFLMRTANVETLLLRLVHTTSSSSEIRVCVCPLPQL